MSSFKFAQPLLGFALVLPLAALAQPEAPASASPTTAALENRLQELQQQIDALRTAQTAAAAPASAPANPVASPLGNVAARAPMLDMGLILSGRYGWLRDDPEHWRLQGFVAPEGEIGPGERGFALEEAELNLSAAIDPYFKGALTLAITSDEGVEIEEARVDSTGLGGGVSATLGRFLSGIGYLNEQHRHSWEFVDAPLMQQAFYGGALRQDGLQLRWLAPLPFYMDLGAELANGAAWPGAAASRHGLGSYALFARSGADIGSSGAWQASLWYQSMRVQEREQFDSNSQEQEVRSSFAGDSDSWGIAAVYKWSPRADMRQQGLKLQVEYMQRREDGELTYDLDGVAQGTDSGSWSLRQAGAYAQAVWRFDRRWRAGVRQDWLDSGTVDIGLVQQGSLQAADFASLLPHSPRRSSLMLELAPSEFSQFRLQWMRDASQPGRADQQVLLQYSMSLGAHPAHSF